jgi:hypothetical protein
MASLVGLAVHMCVMAPVTGKKSQTLKGEQRSDNGKRFYAHEPASCVRNATLHGSGPHLEVLQLLLCQPGTLDAPAAPCIPAQLAVMTTARPFVDDDRAFVARAAIVREVRHEEGDRGGGVAETALFAQQQCARAMVALAVC